ncbi:MAG: hypothetical protein ACXIUD_10525 [Mongoliitalea sp.]
MITELFILTLYISATLYGIGHLWLAIKHGNLGKHEFYWFWVILAVPVIGPLIYFSVTNKPRTRDFIYMKRRRRG